MAIHCFYHSADLDGYCSGAIVKYRFPEAIMHPVTTKSQQLYDIDEEEGVHELHGSCKDTWIELFPNRPVPLAVKLLSLYDTKTYRGHELEDIVLPFQMRMRMEDLNPKDWNEYGWVWKGYFDHYAPKHNAIDHIEQAVSEGRLLLRHDKFQMARYVKEFAFETVFLAPAEYIEALAVNLGHANSKMFDSVWRKECPECSYTGKVLRTSYDEDVSSTSVRQVYEICLNCNGTGYIEPYDLFVPFVRRSDKLWNVSLYSTKPEVDCGAIAKNFGGGGHKGAAGFQCKDLPFEH